MSVNWYKLFNVTEFLAEGLVSRTLVLELEGIGTQTFEIFRGNYVSVLYADTFLPIELLDQNPYAREGYAVYKDTADDVWIGIEADT